MLNKIKNIMVKLTSDKVRISGSVRITIRDATKCSDLCEHSRSICAAPIKRVYEEHNLITTVGRQMIADQLATTSPVNTPKITHVALGTNATAPVSGNTQLGTETFRNAVASLTFSSNQVFATGFYTATEVTGTFEEAGLFSNGTGSANSGIIFSHVPLASIVKGSSETLTVDWTITLN